MDILLFLSLACRVDGLIVKSKTESWTCSKLEVAFYAASLAKFVEIVHHEDQTMIHLSVDTLLSHGAHNMLANWVAMGVDAGVSIAVIEAVCVVGQHWQYQSC
jgi:hypothetical protein